MKDVTAGKRKLRKYLRCLSSTEYCSFCSTLGAKNWAGQEVHPKGRKTGYSILVGKPEGPNRLEYLSVD